MDGLNRVHLAGVDAVGGAETLGELELFVVEIHRDDRIRAAHLGTHDRGQTDAADAEDRHGVALLDVGGVQHGTGAGHHRAADNCRHVGGDVAGRTDHVLLVRDGVVGPGEYTRGDRLAPTDVYGRTRWCATRVGGVPWHPGDEHHVAFIDMVDRRSFLEHDAGGFVAKQPRSSARPVHLVQLRVADAGGELTDHDLVRFGVGKGDLLDFERPGRARHHHHPRGCSHASP